MRTNIDYYTAYGLAPIAKPSNLHPPSMLQTRTWMRDTMDNDREAFQKLRHNYTNYDCVAHKQLHTDIYVSINFINEAAELFISIEPALTSEVNTWRAKKQGILKENHNILQSRRISNPKTPPYTTSKELGFKRATLTLKKDIA